MTISHEELLKVRDLVAGYKLPDAFIRAVDQVSFEVKRGEIFGIVGESGCGKSTLAKSILRLLEPPGYIMAGSALFEDIDLVKAPIEIVNKYRWKKISYIPQTSMASLNPVMKIKDQFMELIKKENKEISKDKAIEIIYEQLASVGLPIRVANSYPHELSGGMKQRVIIAMATLFKPSLIIADEPTTALDVVVQRGILQLLLHLKQKYGTSIIYISHDIAAVAQISDRVAVMYAGKIVEIGDVYDILTKPFHPYTIALLNSIPSLIEKKELKGLQGTPPDLKNPPIGCRFHPRCEFKINRLCDKIEPPLTKIESRYVACHLYR
jgi:peptide/nickel transport system ATP-binding protein